MTRGFFFLEEVNPGEAKRKETSLKRHFTTRNVNPSTVYQWDFLHGLLPTEDYKNRGRLVHLSIQQAQTKITQHTEFGGFRVICNKKSSHFYFNTFKRLQ